MTTKPKTKQTEIKEDIKASNPQLHALYVEWALKHLLYIDKCIRDFGNFGNINMWGPQEALAKARKKLVDGNVAHQDADKLLQSIKEYITIYIEEE